MFGDHLFATKRDTVRTLLTLGVLIVLLGAFIWMWPQLLTIVQTSEEPQGITEEEKTQMRYMINQGEPTVSEDPVKAEIREQIQRVVEETPSVEEGVKEDIRAQMRAQMQAQ